MHVSNKCSIAFHCLIFIHEYGAEHKVTSELLSQSSGCNPVIIRNIMSALKKDGIIAVKPGTGGASLCCSPKEITLYRVCMCVEPDAIVKLIGMHQNPSSLCPIGRNIRSVLHKSYEKVCAGLEASLRSVSLQDMLDDYHQAISDNQLGQ